MSGHRSKPPDKQNNLIGSLCIKMVKRALCGPQTCDYSRINLPGDPAVDTTTKASKIPGMIYCGDTQIASTGAIDHSIDTKQPSLSVVTTTDPVARQLPGLLTSLSELALQLGASYEVVIVDDWGFWQTEPKPAAAQYPGLQLTLLTGDKRQGQQAATLRGIEQARASLILTIDPDLHPCVEEVPEMLALLSDTVWAVHGARSQRRDIGPLRRLGSRIANAMVQAITGLTVKDIGSPVTLLTRQALETMRMPAGANANPKIFGYIALGPALAVHQLVSGSAPRTRSQYSLASLIVVFSELMISSLRTRRITRKSTEQLAP